MFIVISQCVHIFRHTEYISKTLFRRTALGRSSRRTWGRSQRRISRRGSIPTYLSATGRGRRTSSRTARAERGREGGRESQYHSTQQHTAAHSTTQGVFPPHLRERVESIRHGEHLEGEDVDSLAPGAVEEVNVDAAREEMLFNRLFRGGC